MVLLPVELQEAIIDQFGQDKRMLTTLSLVCKYWRWRSYYHSFASIKLTPSSVSVFAGFLSIPCSTAVIVPQVRRVFLSRSTSELSWNTSQRTALHTILRYLSVSGSVTSIKFSRLGTQIIPLFANTGFKTITSIEFSHGHFELSKDFNKFLKAFPRLQHVSFQDVGPFSAEPNSSPLSLRPPPGSYSLSLRILENRLVQRTMKWTRQAYNLPITCDDLHNIGARTFVQSRSITSLFSEIGPYIHSLELMSEFHNILSDDVLSSLDLINITSIRSLRMGSSTRVLSLLPWIPHVLSQLPGPSLRILEVKFASSRQFFLDQPFLRRISEILSAARFRNLSLIHFIITSEVDDKVVKHTVTKLIIETLKGWSVRGALKLTFSKE